ncbi:MAG: hypothetical protein B7Z47_01075 [Chthoniobacter sp. 12-60-6]|nr:MAG: hypothetical protein B7Z47_01075 [Chthoniobacter sp. 12-60-6]
MKTSILFTYALCLMTPGCSLVTVPVKTAGSIVTTTVSTTGKVVAAPFNAIGRNKDSKEEEEEKEKEKPGNVTPEQQELRPAGTTQP